MKRVIVKNLIKDKIVDPQKAGTTKTMIFIKMQKKDKICCKNCGCENHCGRVCKRQEKGYESEGAKAYEIEVCRQCRCEECNA